MNLGDRSRFKPVTFAHQEVLQAWLQWFVHGCSIHAVTSEESRNHGQGKCRQIWLSIWLQVFHFGGCQFVIRSHDRHAHTSAKCIWRAWSIWKSAVILRVRRLQIVLVWKFRSFHFLVAECCWCLCRSNVSDFCLSGCCQEAQERAEFRLSRSYAGRPPCCFWTSESYTERDWDIVGPCWTYCWWSFYVFLCLSMSFCELSVGIFSLTIAFWCSGLTHSSYRINLNSSSHPNWCAGADGCDRSCHDTNIAPHDAYEWYCMLPRFPCPVSCCRFEDIRHKMESILYHSTIFRIFILVMIVRNFPFLRALRFLFQWVCKQRLCIKALAAAPGSSAAGYFTSRPAS
jgi:hypothetical protein